MKLGAHMSISGGVHLALERASEFEMTACQIFTKNDRQWVAKPLDPDNVRRFREQRQSLGFQDNALVSHASYLINLASPDDVLWRKSIAAFQDELERCQALDVPFLVVHPGAHVGSGSDAGLTRVAAALDEIHSALPENPTLTLLETTAGQGSTLGATFEELATIIDLVVEDERVGICLDTCHIFAAGYDIRTPDSYAATMMALDEVVSLSRLRAIHVNDSKHPLGSRKDRHQHIGEGELGLGAFRNLVNDSRLMALPLLLETEKGDDGEGDRRNLATLRGLRTDSA